MADRIVPTLRYRDARKALSWLCEVFGFERQLVVDGEGGGIAHAQLRFGSSILMIGEARDDAIGRIQISPGKTGCVTQSAYLVVADADAVYRRAKAGGAEIVVELNDQPYGSREFSCRDPEGHVWNVGTYDPAAAAG